MSDDNCLEIEISNETVRRIIFEVVKYFHGNDISLINMEYDYNNSYEWIVEIINIISKKINSSDKKTKINVDEQIQQMYYQKDGSSESLIKFYSIITYTLGTSTMAHLYDIRHVIQQQLYIQFFSQNQLFCNHVIYKSDNGSILFKNKQFQKFQASNFIYTDNNILTIDFVTHAMDVISKKYNKISGLFNHNYIANMIDEAFIELTDRLKFITNLDEFKQTRLTNDFINSLSSTLVILKLRSYHDTDYGKKCMVVHDRIDYLIKFIVHTFLVVHFPFDNKYSDDMLAIIFNVLAQLMQ